MLGDDRQLEYRAIRERHPCRSHQIDGDCWEYIAAGSGERTLLLLPGGFGAADTAFRYILAFEHEYRVLSVGYPNTITTVARLADGLAALLALEDAAPAYVLGGSYSGLIAQCLVRRHPAAVAGLILSHTGLPRRERAVLSAGLVALFRVLPMPLLRRALGMMNRAFLPEDTAEHAFWRSYFGAAIARLPRDAYLSRLRVLIDIDRSQRFTPGDLRGARARVLITGAERDWLVSRRERARLARLYPDALHDQTPHGEHGDTLTRPEREIALIRRFLRHEPVADGPMARRP